MSKQNQAGHLSAPYSLPPGTPSPWPPANGLTTQRVPRASVILATSASLQISSPATLVWSIVLDTANYPSWNSFCPRVTIHSQPDDDDEDDGTGQQPAATDAVLRLGTTFTFHVIMDAAKPDKVTDTQLQVTDVSTPQAPSSYIPKETLESDGTYSADLSNVYRISWSIDGGFVTRGLRTERYHEVIPMGDDMCEVRTWECQTGLLARAVKFYFKEVLDTKFMGWCDDLKREAEKRYNEGKSSGEG